MSVLEKKDRGKLDDTVQLQCSITGFINIEGHTVQLNKSRWFINILFYHFSIVKFFLNKSWFFSLGI